jgi:2-polyprenyl-3-methyl-5-hydroxy-6-metoxy-1,4-benzoquinol methylase
MGKIKQMNLETQANNISEFLGVPLNKAKDRLALGFHANHHMVAEDFISTNTNVDDPDSLLNWYRNTDTYIWELSSYHLDEGFNYKGMCEGISLGLFHAGKKDVLSIGDGIGTLSLRMAEQGLNTTYHDLEGSKTAGFAQHRFNKNPDLNIETLFTDSFAPKIGTNKFDGVVALDFLEHVVNVDEWALAIFKCLKKNGVFIPNNAFGIGDAEHGNSIPMHLSINNKYEWEWDPMLLEIGFVRHENGQWWVKP